MLLNEIQQNIFKAQGALDVIEKGIIYKVYKTLGGIANFEKELRIILNKIIDLKNSYIARVESIIRISENKDLLSLLDQGFFEQYTNAISAESLFRLTSFNGFSMPETSLKVISENKNVIHEMNAISKTILDYNNTITDFRMRRNKYYVTLYQIPNNRNLPNVIEGSVNIQNLLPITNVLSSSVSNRSISNNQISENKIKFENNKKFKLINNNSETAKKFRIKD